MKNVIVVAVLADPRVEQRKITGTFYSEVLLRSTGWAIITCKLSTWRDSLYEQCAVHEVPSPSLTLSEKSLTTLTV